MRRRIEQSTALLALRFDPFSKVRKGRPVRQPTTPWGRRHSQPAYVAGLAAPPGTQRIRG